MFFTNSLLEYSIIVFFTGGAATIFTISISQSIQTSLLLHRRSPPPPLPTHLQVIYMSRRNGNVPKLDLKLNLSPPRMMMMNPGVNHESPSRSSTVSPTSPPSSCVSSELNNPDDAYGFSNSPEATSMIVAGCPRCLMYIMLPEKDPRCPKCKSTVLLEVFNDNNNNNNNNNNSNSNNATTTSTSPPIPTNKKHQRN